MTISNEGSASKTTIAKLVKEMLMRRKIQHSTYLCDKDHKELMKTYGSEVKFFDLREDSEALINLLGEDVPYSLIDFPASSLDEIYKVFGDMETFLNSFTMFDAIPVFVMPVISDKSILSVSRLASLLENQSSPYQIVYVMSEGLMKKKEDVYAEFSACVDAQEQVKAGIAQVVTISTKFTSSFANIVKTERLRDFLNKTSNPMDKVLMFDLTRKSDAQFAQVFNEEIIDDRTAMEIGMGVDTTIIIDKQYIKGETTFNGVYKNPKVSTPVGGKESFGKESANKEVNEILLTNVPKKK
ncbi:hypothetical protein ACSFBI_05290 [Variovorax sp. RB3P1]|uniref:hypothetical protein n=1 Tax=Variovorax sp. RB3P1 TaxID=3443732 RepID=UPI003F449264